MSNSHPSGSPHEAPTSPADSLDGFNLRELWQRLARGLIQTAGLASLGLAIAAIASFATGSSQVATTSSRVVFSFNGYERGQYPDNSKFQPDDLRAPEIVTEALKRQGLDSTVNFQSKVRAALNIEGVIPANIIKERDRLRAAGQTLTAYRPDEYAISLTLPRNFPIAISQRELLLNEIVNIFRERFQRTYANMPLAFGNAFDALKDADFFEYELILNEDLQNIANYFKLQSDVAKTFRSQATNLSFGDLLKQTNLFAQIRLNETLGFIRQNGLSKNRVTAMVKMDYYLRTLEDQENKAEEEEKVVQALLAKTQERAQNYVLATKAQVPQGNQPLLDQNFIDSLLANDSYNFLVRKALEAGLALKRIQSEKSILLERRKNMERFLKDDTVDQRTVMTQVQTSLTALEQAYNVLISSIRRTHEDYARQQYADAVRISMQAETSSFLSGLIKACVVGVFVGTAAGVGLSLLGVYLGSNPNRPRSA